MSSTYLIHSLVAVLQVAIAHFSNHSMYKLAITGEIGNPIAAPAIGSKKLVLKYKVSCE